MDRGADGAGFFSSPGQAGRRSNARSVGARKSGAVAEARQLEGNLERTRGGVAEKVNADEVSAVLAVACGAVPAGGVHPAIVVKLPSAGH